jgi:simple sugar transport system permease protein
MFGSMLAALGGAFLTLSSAGLFVPQISGGRGWIAIALVIFGNWSPTRILLGALFFGLIDSFQLQLQAVGVDLPYQLLSRWRLASPTCERAECPCWSSTLTAW